MTPWVSFFWKQDKDPGGKLYGMQHWTEVVLANVILTLKWVALSSFNAVCHLWFSYLALQKQRSQGHTVFCLNTGLCSCLWWICRLLCSLLKDQQHSPPPLEWVGLGLKEDFAICKRKASQPHFTKLSVTYTPLNTPFTELLSRALNVQLSIDSLISHG